MKRAVFALLVGVVLGAVLMVRFKAMSVPTWSGKHTVGVGNDLRSVARALFNTIQTEGSTKPTGIEERWREALRSSPPIDHLYLGTGYGGDYFLSGSRGRFVEYGMTDDGSDVYVRISGSTHPLPETAGDEITAYGRTGAVFMNEGHHRTKFWPTLRRCWPWCAGGLALWYVLVCSIRSLRRVWFALIVLPLGATLSAGGFMFDSPYWDLGWSQSGLAVSLFGCVTFSVGVSWSLWPLAVWLVRMCRGRFPKHCCQSCGYDTSGIPSEVCPECGTPVHRTQTNPT